jgi:hypothetical protein
MRPFGRVNESQLELLYKMEHIAAKLLSCVYGAIERLKLVKCAICT